MPDPIAVRLFDALLGFLLRPRVRRVRRWSFLVTAPLGFLVGRSLGIDLGDGVVLGAVAALLDAAVVVGVTLGGARLLRQGATRCAARPAHAPRRPAGDRR